MVVRELEIGFSNLLHRELYKNRIIVLTRARGNRVFKPALV